MTNILKYMKEKVFMNKLKFFITIVVLIIIDQLSKFCIILNKNNLPATVINGIFKFRYCENRGIAFGLASGYVSIVSIFTLIILIAIIFLVCLNFKKLNSVCATGVALLTAGGFGNLIDRMFRSFVVDFMDFSDLINFPIFNVADICVVVGVVLIGISCIIDYRREKIEGNNC